MKPATSSSKLLDATIDEASPPAVGIASCYFSIWGPLPPSQNPGSVFDRHNHHHSPVIISYTTNIITITIVIYHCHHLLHYHCHHHSPPFISFITTIISSIIIITTITITIITIILLLQLLNLF